MESLSKLCGDVKDIPDLKYVIDTLSQIFEFMTTNDMITLKELNIESYKQNIRTKFADFEERYFSLFNVILDGELDSMTHLVMMIKSLCLVRTGQISMDTAFANIREELSNHYIYPQFGGKKAFENAVIARGNAKKEKSKAKHKKKYELSPK